MRRHRFFIAIAACAFVAIPLMAQLGSTIKREFIEYDPAPGPGELYFIANTNPPAGATSVLWTNLQAYMWYPLQIRLTWAELPITNTLTVKQVKRLRTDYYFEYEVVTNEFGNIASNYLHQLTNTVYSKWTNNLYPAQSSICTGGTIRATFPYEYMQRTDSLLVEWDYTNLTPWISITGRR